MSDEAVSPTDLIRKTIKRGLKESGYSQKQLAEYLGFTQKHVSQMLTGHAGISLDYLPFILNFVGMRLAITKKEDSQ